MPSPSSLVLEFHGVRCCVELHDESLRKTIEALFSHALCDTSALRDGTHRAHDLRLSIGRGTGVPPVPEAPTFQLIADRIIWGSVHVQEALVFSDGRSTARVNYAQGRVTLQLTEHDESALYTAAHRLFPIALGELLRTRGVFYLHAAAVVDALGAVVIVGDSEAGKSTLAYCALRDGMTLVADDGLLFALDEHGAAHVEPFYRDFNLDRATITTEDLTRTTPSEPMNSGAPRVRFLPAQACLSARARVAALARIERTNGPSQVILQSQPELLTELLRQNPFVALTHELASSHLSALGQMLRGARLGLVRSGPDIIAQPGAARRLLQAWLTGTSEEQGASKE